MAEKHVVVDGSNIATEGRSRPSLQQLEEAVAAYVKEHGDVALTVVVDATFGHRIDASERARFDEAIDHNEMVTPPAGAIGRGDAFVLEIADRVGATVLSNDSFQEFHGTYDWLFDEGRLIGGKPVPEVGWIFLPRTPVRGPTSRKAVSEAKRKRNQKKSAAASKRGTKKTAKKSSKKSSTRGAKKDQQQQGQQKRQRSKAGSGNEPEPYNEPLPFIEFVAAHPVGETVEGEIERFSSHGCYVIADGTRCYLSLKNMGDPPPTSPKDAVSIGDTREFVVVSIDTPRRGVDLAIPGFEPGDGDGASSASSSDTEPEESKEERVSAKKASKRKAPTKKRAVKKKAAAKKRPAKKRAVKKKAAAKKRPAKKRPAKRSRASKKRR